MKLQEICENLHFDALKAPGTIIECFKNIPCSHGRGYKAGDIFKVAKDQPIYSNILSASQFDKNIISIFKNGISNFKKVEL